jgi:formamidopyrimidine-DNA glycosylase
MPELPEVETIANGLRQGSNNHPGITGLSISGAQVLWSRSIAQPDSISFQRQILGQQITRIGRRAKFLTLELSRDTLIIHLRMSGDLLVEPIDAPLAKHHRVILFLGPAWRLAFNDARKFGRMWLVSDPQEVLGHLGPEPLDPELTPQHFYERLVAKQRPLKPLLLDQSFIAGLGNIYSDEALFLSGIHPLRKSNDLAPDQAARLLASIRQVLQAGIHHHGASIDWVYRGGDFQNFFYVYRRTNQPCRICATPIQRIVVGQRSTHFCPSCQPLPKE